MTINFKRVGGNESENDRTDLEQQRPFFLQLPPVTQFQAEENLFHFLRGLLQNQIQSGYPLLLEQETLHGLYTNPQPELVLAMRHHLDNFLVQLTLNTAEYKNFTLSPHLWGFLLATYNCLTRSLSYGENDPVIQFTTTLIETIPPAETLAEALTYHAILQETAVNLAHLPAKSPRALLLHRLINRSPLTAIYHPHLHTPPPLTSLAADLCRWWRRKVADPAPWSGLEHWLDALAPLLNQPAIATYLRQRWLTLPENHLACRNLGLLLEALRRHGKYRDFLLTFYEAYDYFAAETVSGTSQKTYRFWPLLNSINQLLRTGGESDSEEAIQLNQTGNEYFLKFYPLIQTIIAEKGVPRDYQHLTVAFIQSLRPLLNFTSIHSNQTADTGLGNIVFISKDTA